MSVSMSTIQESNSLKLLCNHCTFGFLFLLWNLPANNHSTHAGCRDLSVPYAICFQLSHWVKTGGCGGGCWKALRGRFDPLCWESPRYKKKKTHDGGRINSLTSGRALESVQPQHFQADYLRPHFYFIFNLTATGSVTAVVLCAILFL